LEYKFPLVNSKSYTLLIYHKTEGATVMKQSGNRNCVRRPVFTKEMKKEFDNSCGRAILRWWSISWWELLNANS